MSLANVCEFNKLQNIKDFFNFKESPDIELVDTEPILNTKDKSKKNLVSALVNRWMVYDIGEDNVYVKHVPSERKDILYQIIIGGDEEWNGVYELSFLRGRPVLAQGFEENGVKILSIRSKGNYDVAVFAAEGGKSYTITRMDYDSDKQFQQALLDSKLIDAEELEIYFKPRADIKPYLNKILPRIRLQ